ncbi:MAG: hypothetical protein ACF8GE_03040 [Phycisphaerales bacterium JB043]
MLTPTKQRGRYQVLAWCAACLTLYAMSALAMAIGWPEALPGFVFLYVGAPLAFSGLSWLNAESITRVRTRVVLLAMAILPYGAVAMWIVSRTRGTLDADVGRTIAIVHAPVAGLYAWWLWWVIDRRIRDASSRASGCPHCGYSREGLEDGVCPECGNRI